MRKIFYLVLCLLLPIGVQATLIFPPEDIGRMAENSDLVVYGEITRHTVDEFHNEFLITDVVKGNKQVGDHIVVREYGNRVGDRFTVISGDVNYELGRNYLLFLWESPNGDYKAHLLAMSVFLEGTIQGKSVLAHTASVLDLEFAGAEYDVASGINGSYDRDQLLSHLKGVVNGTNQWNTDKAGIRYNVNIVQSKHHSVDFQPKAAAAAPCPNDQPCHCTTLFDGITANPAKFENSTFTVCVAGGASSDPTNPNAITDLGNAVSAMNGMPGLSISYTGVDAACSPIGCTSGAASGEVAGCAGGDCNKMFVFFDDPCNEIADVDANCNGVLGIGGHFASSATHTDLCGDVWNNGCNPYFVMNNFGGCSTPPSTYAYTSVLIHEMLHAVGVGHIGGDAVDPCVNDPGCPAIDGSCPGSTQCNAIMNPVVCNANEANNVANFGISALDNACTDWMYNPSAATNCAITNVSLTVPAVCNGDNAEFEICFDVSEGSGAYDIEVDGMVVVDAAAGAMSGTNNCVNVSVTGPTAAGNVTVNVRDDVTFACVDATNLSVALPQCPPPCASACADILNATAPDCGNTYYTDAGTYPGPGTTSINSGDGSGAGCQTYAFDSDNDGFLDSGIPLVLGAGSGSTHTICTEYTATTNAQAFPPFLLAGDPACIDQTITVYEAATCADVSGTAGVTVNQPGGGFAGDVSGLTPNTNYVVCFDFTENGCAAGTDFIAEICPDIVETGVPPCASIQDATVPTDVCNGDDITIEFGANCTTDPSLDGAQPGSVSGYGLILYLDGNGIPTTFPSGSNYTANDILTSSDPNLIFNTVNGGACTDLVASLGLINATCAPIDITLGVVNLDVVNFLILPDCPITEYTVTVYPNYESIIYSNNSCNPVVGAFAGDGTGTGLVFDTNNDAMIDILDACDSAELPGDCTDGATLDYDFSALVDANDPGCSTGLTGTLTCTCASPCASTTGSSVSPSCTGGTFDVTLGSPVTTPDQDGFLLVYDLDPGTAETTAEIYDDITGAVDDPDIEFYGEQSDDTGAGFVNVAGFFNPTCGPITVDLYIVPADITNGTIDPTCAVEGPVTMTIYPILEVVTLNDGTCNPEAWALVSDGNGSYYDLDNDAAITVADACGSEPANPATNCTADIPYDFSGLVDANDPGCSTGLTGTLSCVCGPTCASTTGSSVNDVCAEADFTVTLGSPTTTADQDGFLLVYDFDPNTAETATEIYDDITGTVDDPDLSFFGEQTDATGAGFVDLSGFINESCNPISVDLYVVPADITNGFIDPSCAVEGPITITIYPSPLSVDVVDDGSSCGTPLVELYSADNTFCGDQMGAACVDNGDTFDYDFSTDFAWIGSEPAGCAQAVSGTITCAACTVPCTATAGTMTVDDSNVCVDGVTGLAIGAIFDPNLGVGYDNWILLTDNSGNILDIFGMGDNAVIPFSDFETIYGTGQDFCLYSYNFDASNGQVNAPAPDPFGIIAPTSNVSDIGTTDAGCFDLSDPVCFTVPTCVCDLAVDVILNNGNNGSVSPFYYNTAEVDIYNGTPPYSYDWSVTGYVRNGIINPTDPTVGGANEIRVIYADNAMWTVTITDANGCEVVATNDPTDGAGGIHEVLDITSADVTGDICITRSTGEGAITVYTEHGTPPYTYEWEGPFSWSNPGPLTGTPWTGGGGNGEEHTITDLPYGWYSLTVTDSGDPAGPFDANGGAIIDSDPDTPLPIQMSEGWYWVQCVRAGGGGRGKVESDIPIITISPNPISQEANIEFSIPQEGLATIELFDVDGRKVLNLFKGNVEGEIVNNMIFQAGPLASGIYVVALTAENGEKTYERLIITK